MDYESVQQDLINMWFHSIRAATVVLFLDTPQANRFTVFADECAAFWRELQERAA
jgi:hypothetical protein